MIAVARCTVLAVIRRGAAKSAQLGVPSEVLANLARPPPNYPDNWNHPDDWKTKLGGAGQFPLIIFFHIHHCCVLCHHFLLLFFDK